MTNLHTEAQEIAAAAIRLDNDVNGNPRYYVPCFMFFALGNMYRPAFATKYRGRKYGAGWVFQSYNLVEDLRLGLEEIKSA
jgi:hypothetical protein